MHATTLMIFSSFTLVSWWIIIQGNLWRLLEHYFSRLDALPAVESPVSHTENKQCIIISLSFASS